jgi:hypothetical protein
MAGKSRIRQIGMSATLRPQASEETSMPQLPWVIAAILAIMIVEIALAFALQVLRADD